MGEIAEMMLEGTLCCTCGVYFGNLAQGYPVQCEDCEHEWKDPAAGPRTIDPGDVIPPEPKRKASRKERDTGRRWR